MNKQRKVLITITYNELGIIVDTKAEELGSSAQPESCEGCKWENAFGYGECGRCRRRLEDMYEMGTCENG